MVKSIFIALPKNPEATGCEFHRAISLRSHFTKSLVCIVIGRMKRVSKHEIGNQQFGFVPDAGTKTTIVIMRMLSERVIDSCFID